MRWLTQNSESLIDFVTAPVNGITSLALFLPGLSVWIRRLHDTDRSGWWTWILLIPIVGFIVALIFALLPSKMGLTRWNNRIQL